MRETLIQRISAYATTCILGTALAACASMHLGKPLSVNVESWPMFGRDSLHTNQRAARISLPLALAWEYDISAGMGSGSPVASDSVLIAGTLRGELHAIRLSNGSRLGLVTLGEAIHGSPALSGTHAFVPLSHSTNAIIAYNLISGQPTWSHRPGDVETSILRAGGQLFFGTTDGGFLALDERTGRVAWRFTLPENTTYKGVRSSPVLIGTTVCFGADDGVVYALDARSGGVLWTYRTGASIAAAPAADTAMLVVGSTAGTLFALDGITGLPRWRAACGTPIVGHALITPISVVVATTSGVVIAFARGTGVELWRNQVGGPVVAGPAGTETLLFLGTLDREMLALNLEDGMILWREKTEGRIKTPPILAGETIIFATDDRTLVAYRGSQAP